LCLSEKNIFQADGSKTSHFLLLLIFIRAIYLKASFRRERNFVYERKVSCRSTDCSSPKEILDEIIGSSCGELDTLPHMTGAEEVVGYSSVRRWKLANHEQEWREM